MQHRWRTGDHLIIEYGTMQGCSGMRRRFTFLQTGRGSFGGMTALATVPFLPPASASDFVDDHVAIIVPAIVGAIVLLLLVALLMRRSARKREGAKPKLVSVPAQGGEGAAAAGQTTGREVAKAVTGGATDWGTAEREKPKQPSRREQ